MATPNLTQVTTPASSTPSSGTASSTATQPQPNPNHTTASLYVGDLAPEVTEALLFDAFKAIGHVSSIRVCRDTITRRSLGYAYVNYLSVADAERALDSLNFSPIAGRPCRIMWSQRDPAKRKTGVGNIFIKNLDKAIDNSNLYDTFSAFGNILSCKVELDSTGQSKGYGYVHYETQDEAELAISRVNNMLLAGKQVFVGPFLPRKDRSKDEIDKKFTNVFVKNLSEDVSTDKLSEEFKKFGPIQNAIVTLDETTKKSKGFGFVSFENAEDASKAVDALNGQTLGQKVVFVGRAQKKSEREEELKTQRIEAMQKYQGVNLYVKNLDDAVDDDRLRQEFSRFGSITSARVMRDEKNNSRGFGFVCFSTPDEATRAVTEMNGSILISKPLYVGLAQRKDIRRAQLEAQHAQRSMVGAIQGGAPGIHSRMPPGAPIPQMPGMPFPAGAPMFYQMGQPRVMYPQQQMMPRPRFTGNQNAPNSGTQQPQPSRPQGFPQQTGMSNYAASGNGGQRNQGQRGGNPNYRGGRVGQPQSPNMQGTPAVNVAPNTASTNPQNTSAQNGKPRQQTQQQAQQPQQQGSNNPNNQRVKFSSTARNQPQNQVAPVQQTGNTPQTAEQLEAMMGGTEEAKQVVGEQLFVQISRQQPQLAGKITGMFLDSLELRELFALLQSKPALDGKVLEALHVLQTAQQGPDGANPIVTEGIDSN